MALGWPVRKGTEGWAWAGGGGGSAGYYQEAGANSSFPWLARNSVSVKHSFHIGKMGMTRETSQRG